VGSLSRERVRETLDEEIAQDGEKLWEGVTQRQTRCRKRHTLKPCPEPAVERTILGRVGW
jgi:hypothetical protein